MSLPPAFADRLVKLLGMVGSAHDGEALNAARLADKLLRDAGLTWADVIGTPAASPDTDPFIIARACIEILQSGLWLRPNERQFLTGLPKFRHPTEKQLDWLNDLLDRAREYASRPPPPPPPTPKPRKTRAPGKRTPKSKPAPADGDGADNAHQTAQDRDETAV
jgi:hypothetical protein